MKRLISLLFTGLFFVVSPALSDEVDANDEWTDIGKMQNAWDGQEIITDDQFDKIIEQRTKRSKEKAQKNSKKNLEKPLFLQNKQKPT